MLRVVLGMNLKYHRMRQGLTQEEAAAKCKVSSEYFGKVERGAQAATIDMIEKMSIGLNVSAQALLNEAHHEVGEKNEDRNMRTSVPAWSNLEL